MKCRDVFPVVTHGKVEKVTRMRSVAATQHCEHSNQRTRRTLSCFVFLIAVVIAATASAQKPKNAKKDDPKLKPRPVTLKTKDGVELRAFFFPSDKLKDEKGKEAPTVLVVHEWEGQASPYLNLVMALKEAGCAVLIPDYRGHGGSKEYVGRGGKMETFNVAQMGKRDVENIILLDLEKAKGYLKDENNSENLNLNALVVIGIREGCVMATHWAARDWSFPSIGSKKQGQDVKALVLISPEKQIKSISLDQALTNPTILRLPIMVVAGKDSPEGSEAERVIKRIEGIKKRMGGGTVSKFESKMVSTALSGPSLVNDVSDVIPAIVKFVTTEVDAKDDNPWVNRE
ncbi:Alpha/beta hydrolase family protein [Rubripirellula tenax]|uniref:Alpha/beta hydrolase family protein n=1 Tax=Rubripirellula tenax TaxID=2528015 RepID=A0A5C6FEL2_9BACT|nr:alpha/beta hydrolase [Rubripirellula tenax]TWU60246.1 Alpha/beta hydrolase family protein [Rubripirellula tenax]